MELESAQENMWQGDVLKAFFPRHRFDIVSITLGNWIKT